MQAITALTQEIGVKLSEATSLASPRFNSTWIEFSGSTIENPEAIIGSKFSTFTNAAVVSLVPVATTGNQRQHKYTCIRNSDAITHNIEIYYDVADTHFDLKIELLSGEHLIYVDSRGWYVLDVHGAIKNVDVIASVQQHASRIILSGSTSGRPIAVAATATPGTLIHTAVGSVTSYDEVWFWVTNRTNAAATLTIEWGGTGNSDHLTEALSIPANSAPIPIATGQVLNNNLIIRAFSGTANALNISGYVNRIV